MFPNINQLVIISSFAFGLGIMIGRMFLSNSITPKKRRQTSSQTDSDLEYTSSSNFTEIQNFLISDIESEDVDEEEDVEEGDEDEHSDSETEPITEQDSYPDTQELNEGTQLDNGEGTQLDNGECTQLDNGEGTQLDNGESVELNSDTNTESENSEVIVDSCLEVQQNSEIELDAGNDKIGNFYSFRGDFKGPYTGFTVANKREKNEYFDSLEEAIMNAGEKDMAIVENSRGFSLSRGWCGNIKGINHAAITKKKNYKCWIREDVLYDENYGERIRNKLGITIE